MILSMQKIVEARNAGKLAHLPFDRREFFYLSLIGELDVLQGCYIRSDEPDYPAWGLSVVIISLSNQAREVASLVEKLVNGNVWFLATWEVDTDERWEHVTWGQRWKHPIVFDTMGNEFSQMSKSYREALCA